MSEPRVYLEVYINVHRFNVEYVPSTFNRRIGYIYIYNLRFILSIRGFPNVDLDLSGYDFP